MFQASKNKAKSKIKPLRESDSDAADEATSSTQTISSTDEIKTLNRKQRNLIKLQEKRKKKKMEKRSGKVIEGQEVTLTGDKTEALLSAQTKTSPSTDKGKTLTRKERNLLKLKEKRKQKKMEKRAGKMIGGQRVIGDGAGATLSAQTSSPSTDQQVKTLTRKERNLLKMKEKREKKKMEKRAGKRVGEELDSEVAVPQELEEDNIDIQDSATMKRKSMPGISIIQSYQYIEYIYIHILCSH